MDTKEWKRVLDENCDKLAQILDDCRKDSAINLRVVEVMEPMLREIQELKDLVFCETEHAKDQP